MMKGTYITDIRQIPFFQTMPESEQEILLKVTDRFPFRASKHYLSLIDWNNPKDPVKRIIFPDPRELDASGSPDPSLEKNYTVQHGLQHKYPQTSLLLLSDVCGGICRFCFRKRLFMDSKRQTVRDYMPALGYVRDHPEVTDVLLTGGDPLILSTSRLKEVIGKIMEIDHIGVIRIGTKMLVYNPFRITGDPELISLIKDVSAEGKKIYIMAHINHPNEISSESVKAIRMLQQAGVAVVNQTPIIEGVNNDQTTMADLFRKLSFMGISPYYVFQCRPTIGNYIYSVPVEQSFHIFQNAFKKCSGLAKRARFIMSHSTGKIEVVGVTERNIFMRYHQAAHPDDYDKFLVSRSNPQAHWLDDYEPFYLETAGTVKEWFFEQEQVYSRTAAQ